MDATTGDLLSKSRMSGRALRAYRPRRDTKFELIRRPSEQPAAYGTVDGDRLVQSWLERMDDDVPAWPPRAKLAGALRESESAAAYSERHGDDRTGAPRGTKRARSPGPARPRSPRSPDFEELPPSPPFAKRPRHKTRADKYDVKQTVQKRPREKSDHPKRRTEESSRKRLTAGRDLVDNFASDAILNERLTVCRFRGTARGDIS